MWRMSDDEAVTFAAVVAFDVAVMLLALALLT